MKTTSAMTTSVPPAAQAPDALLLNAALPNIGPLNGEEFAALLAIDGSLRARRPPAATEIRLRRLGLIEPNPLSRWPVRTPKGEALIAAAGVAGKAPVKPVEPD
jgi:hypothetical protein